MARGDNRQARTVRPTDLYHLAGDTIMATTDTLDALRERTAGGLGAWQYEGDAGTFRARAVMLERSASLLAKLGKSSAAKRVAERADLLRTAYTEAEADRCDRERLARGEEPVADHIRAEGVQPQPAGAQAEGQNEAKPKAKKGKGKKAVATAEEAAEFNAA